METSNEGDEGGRMSEITDGTNQHSQTDTSQQSATYAQIDRPPSDEDGGVVDANENNTRSFPSSGAASLMGQVPNFPLTSNGGTTNSPQVDTMAIAQLAALSHISQARGQSTMPSIDASSLMHDPLSAVSSISSLADFQHDPQASPHAQPLQHTQASLLHQLQLASLAHQNVAGLQMSVPQASLSPSSLQASLLNQLASAQTAQANPFISAPQQTQALINAYLLQQLLVSQNPSLVPIAPQNQSQLLQIMIHQNNIKGQLIQLILSQQQTQTTAFSSNIASSQIATPVNQMELLMRSMVATNPSGSTPGTANYGMMPTVATDRVHPFPEQSFHYKSNIDAPTITSPAHETESEAERHCPSKEERWMIRYEELKQFQQKHGHCNVPHGYEGNRKLSWWVMNQRAQHQSFKQGKKNWLSTDRIALLDAIEFNWKPRTKKRRGK